MDICIFIVIIYLCIYNSKKFHKTFIITIFFELQCFSLLFYLFTFILFYSTLYQLRKCWSQPSELTSWLTGGNPQFGKSAPEDIISMSILYNTLGSILLIVRSGALAFTAATEPGSWDQGYAELPRHLGYRLSYCGSGASVWGLSMYW